MSTAQLPLPGAHAASAFAACSYVGVLYLFRSTRTRPLELDPHGRRRDRLHPDILRARLCAVAFSTLLSLILVAILANSYSRPPSSFAQSVHQTLVLTGLRLPHIGTVSEHLRVWIQPVVLTGILFWGALYTQLILEPKPKPSPERVSAAPLADQYSLDIYLLRALVLGPLCEEIVFRACILAFHLLVQPAHQLSKTRLIFTTPLWFGFAHVHGIWETYRSLGGNRQALKMATIQTTVQFLYTTIFGWYAAFIYLRTGSVISATLCHSFCNYMGLPPILDAMQRFPHKRISIAVHYLMGVFSFAFLVRRWAADPSLFPSNPSSWTSATAALAQPKAS